jgi:hypothetical protein
MLLDDVMPEFDATRIEHRVIEGGPAAVYEAAVAADQMDVFRDSTWVRGLFVVRGAGERLAAAVRGSPPAPLPEPAALRLADLPDHGDWVRLGEDPPKEFVFGVIGRFWAGQTLWEQIDAVDFRSFNTPGYAKIAANFSLRAYGDHRTLLSYEARTQATDDAARRGFLRYWTVVSPGVGMVMRATLAAVDVHVRRFSER